MQWKIASMWGLVPRLCLAEKTSGKLSGERRRRHFEVTSTLFSREIPQEHILRKSEGLLGNVLRRAPCLLACGGLLTALSVSLAGRSLTCLLSGVQASSQAVASSQAALQQKIARAKAELRRTPNSARAHNELGVLLGEAGNLTESIQEFAAAVRLKKDYAQAYYNLGIAWVQAAKIARGKEPGGEVYYRNLDCAFAALHQAAELQPSLPNVHNLLGWLDEEVGDVPSAIHEFEAAVQRQPNSADAYNNLGTALARQRDYVKATAAYQKAIEDDPHFVKAEINLESVIQRAHASQKILAMRQEEARRIPHSALAHAFLGHAYLINGCPAQAEAELRKAVRLDPRLAIAQYYLGQALQNLGNVQESLRHLNAAVRLSPETPEFLSAQGVLLLRTGKTPEAIATLRRAVALDPNNASFHYVLATALQKMGKHAEAAKQFEESTRINNTERELEGAGLYVLNGIKDLRAGKLDDAIRNLQQAVDQKPDYTDANYYLGIALAEKGEGKSAKAAFERALAKRPQSVEIHYNYGIALWQMGEAAQAIQEFRQTVNLNPNDGLARCALGKALLREGEEAEGRSMLKKAQKLGACLPSEISGGSPK